MYKTNNGNETVRNFEPLINKITKQFFDKLNPGNKSGTRNMGCTWDDLKSMAYEGFALAINKYDPKRSNMSFTQFAAFAIRNNILTSLDNEIRVVKLSAYAQKKVSERGESLFNTISIDRPVRDDDNELTPREIVTNMYEEENFSNGDIFKYLYTRLENEFTERDYTIFYKVFGLKGYDETSGRVIAKEYGVSEGLVSQRLKKVVTYIRHDKDLCEMLGSLIH